MSKKIKKIFDFNIHFPVISAKIEDMVNSEKSINTINLQKQIEDSNYDVSGANIMIFNTDFVEHTKIRDTCKKKFDHVMLTQLVNPNDFKKNLKLMDIDAIKFHSYHQNITSKDYDKIIGICYQSEKIIIIDTSYGSTKMYKNSPMELACLVAEEVKDKPIILLHSGGLKCMEAMLLAQSQNNIYLETSFSYLNFYGSNIACDLRYIYKNIGSDKILFASDSPYCPLEEQIYIFDKMLSEIGFDSNAKNKVFYQNALDLLCQ